MTDESKEPKTRVVVSFVFADEDDITEPEFNVVKTHMSSLLQELFRRADIGKE